MLEAKPRDEEKPCRIEKYRPKDHCDGRETSARLESFFPLTPKGAPDGKLKMPEFTKKQANLKSLRRTW